MSQAAASLPSTRRAPAERRTPTTRPHLQALPLASRRGRPRLFYAAVTVLTVMTVVLTQLLLSIGVSQGAYRIESLQSTKSHLSRQYQQASEDVQALSSPQNLVANAQALGMVSDATPVYLRLSDGAVIGAPTPASATAGSASQLVPNALTQNVPLVTAPKTSGVKSGASAPTAAASGQDAAAAGAGTSTGSDSATPNANDSKGDGAPVPWTGALPAPSTH